MRKIKDIWTTPEASRVRMDELCNLCLFKLSFIRLISILFIYLFIFFPLPIVIIKLGILRGIVSLSFRHGRHYVSWPSVPRTVSVFISLI